MELFENLLYEVSGEGQVLSTAPLTIPGLEGERPLTLYLPPDYAETPEQLYPIAYLFDGQNLYDREIWPAGWQLHRILDARAAAGLTVPIVVGIHHGPNRDEELCPWPAERGQTPRGDALLDWLVEELHPQLVAELRILDHPACRLVGGSSLGGLLALYAGFRHSDFFGQVMVMSPSLWVGDGAVYTYIAEAAFLHNLDFLRLYVDCGALEGEEETDEQAWSGDFFDDRDADADEEEELEPEDSAAAWELAYGDEEEEPAEDDEDAEEWETDPLEDAEYLVDILEAKGFVDGQHFLWVPDPEGTHDEWHWSKRLPLALSWLYRDDTE
ncbi:MAG: alpha/beta hydrolase [Candidatus Sericytochromatia bacterium]